MFIRLYLIFIPSTYVQHLKVFKALLTAPFIYFGPHDNEEVGQAELFPFKGGETLVQRG